MKLTKATLKQLIAEVMKEEKGKLAADLAPVQRFLRTGVINTTVEYAQLVKLLLGYPSPGPSLDKSRALVLALDTTMASKIMQHFGQEAATGDDKPDVAPPTGVPTGVASAGDKTV